MALEQNIDWWRPRPPAYRQQTVSAARPALRSETGKWAFRFLLLLIAVMILAPQNRLLFLEPLRPALVLAFLSAAAYAYSQISRGLPIIQRRQATLAVAMLLAWAVLTLPLSYWPGGSVDYLINFYLKNLIVFYLLVFIINDLHRLWTLCWCFALSSLPLTLATINNFRTGTGYQGDERISGYIGPLTENPNDMALMLNIILPLSISLFLASKKFSARLLSALISVLLVVGIVLTFSRAGFIALGVTLICFMWLIRNRAERVLIPVVLLMGLAALPMLPSGYLDRISTITEIEEDETGSAQTRTADMIAATRYIVTHPIVGSGIGNNALAMNEARGSTWTEVHNIYLQFGVSLGLPGLILFLIALRLAWRACDIRRHRHTPMYADERFRTLGQGIRVLMLTFMVESFFHPIAYSAYFYMVAGLAVAIHTIATRSTTHAGPQSTPEIATR